MPHDQPLASAETPEQAIRDSVRRFTAQHSSFRRIREQRGCLPGFSRDLWRQMADLGWFGTLIAEDDGGMGLGLAEAAAIAEGLATSLCPEPFSGSAMLATAILRDCEGAVRDDLLGAVVAGETIVAVAWQVTPTSSMRLAARRASRQTAPMAPSMAPSASSMRVPVRTGSS